MSSPVPRQTRLPPELVSAAISALDRDERETRMVAAQLLARGWALDEESRLEETTPTEQARSHLRLLRGRCHT